MSLLGVGGGGWGVLLFILLSALLFTLGEGSGFLALVDVVVVVGGGDPLLLLHSARQKRGTSNFRSLKGTISRIHGHTNLI